MVDSLDAFFQQNEEFVDNSSPHFDRDHDLYSIFESLESVAEFTMIEDNIEPTKDGEEATSIVISETELETSPKTKRLKTSATTTTTSSILATTTNRLSSSEELNPDGSKKMSHITVERNRRKQMNEHLTLLRSLMPCFYVKKGDQASIIGGVVEYIKELQQILQSLEAKKQRKVYSEVLSPRVVSSPRSLSTMSPRKQPPSPKPIPISPRTPQPTSPYTNRPQRLQQQQQQQPPTAIAVVANSLEGSPCNSSANSCNIIEKNYNKKNDVVGNVSTSCIAEVEVKFRGSNLVLKTVSPPIHGQAVKIINALQLLSLEILHVNITTVDHTMFGYFTIKIGIDCQLSAEELVHQIQKTFC